jgi:hypothetical protein
MFEYFSNQQMVVKCDVYSLPGLFRHVPPNGSKEALLKVHWKFKRNDTGVSSTHVS